MKMFAALAAACLALTFAALPAEARTVRHAPAGGPAIEFDIPDEWGDRMDDNGNLHISAPDHTVDFSITVGADSTYAVDRYVAEVAEMVHATLARAGDTQISGIAGGRWIGTLPFSDLTLNIEIFALRANPNWLVSVSLISHPTRTAPDTLNTAHLIMQSARLSGV